MARLRTHVDPSSETWRANDAAMRALVAELRAKTAALTERGAAGDERSIARHRERGKLPVRERIDRLLDPGSPFLELCAARGERHVRRRRARRRHRHGHRQGQRHRVRHRRQRRDGQGRHVLPDDRQEAPPRPGDRARRTACRASTWSTRAARSCRSRTRSSPTATTSAASSTTRRSMSARGHPAGRARDGLVHGRRRVRAGDERRDGHRPRHRHDLPGRPAAGEGRDRRGRHRRGAGRGQRPRAHQRRRRPRGARRRARAGDRARDRRQPGLAEARPAVGPASPRPPAVATPDRRRRPAADDPHGIYGAVSRRPARGLRRARGDRPTRRRLRVPRVQGRLRRDAGVRLRATSTASRSASWPTTACCSASRRSRARTSSSSPASARSRSSSCRTSPASWSAREYEAGGIAKDGAKLVTAVACAGGAQVHGHHRWLVRRRELRHGRSRVRLRGLWMWPNARISVMGGEQAAMVLSHGRHVQGRWPSATRYRRATIRAKYEREGNPYYSTARLWDDGVIDPAQTRDVLALAIAAALNAPIARDEVRRLPDVGGPACRP